MSANSAISTLDLSQLPAPDVVEPLDFETIFSAMLADLRARDPDFDALVESDPVFKLLQAAAYAVLIYRARINAAAKATMLAFAVKSDLDQIGATRGVVRLESENDADFRKRIQLSPEGYTTAGSEGSYLFHGLSASPDVKDVQAISPTPDDIRQLVLDVLSAHGAAPALVDDMTAALDGATWPGTVDIYVLSREDDGTADVGLLGAVAGALSAETVRPLTDNVRVHSASVTTYEIVAELIMYPGPDAELVRQAAMEAVTKYAMGIHRLRYDVSVSGLHAALHQPGVQHVNLTSPVGNLIAGNGEAFFPAEIAVTIGGSDV